MAGYGNAALAERLREMREGGLPKVSEGKPAPKPKRGDAIFEHAGGPRTWAEYVGQRRARGQLKAAVASAKFRNTRLDHVLISSGLPGVGKSALAGLLASEMGVGLTEVQGKITRDEAQAILAQMDDHDILFLDEVHQLTEGGKYVSEWLLPLLADGTILSASGEWKAPNITVVAASTNAAVLSEAIQSRFVIKPIITPYKDDEAVSIASGMAESIFVSAGLDAPSEGTLRRVALACNNMPRQMESILRTLRDAGIGDMAERDEHGDSDLTEVFSWTGINANGLSQMAQRMLAILLVNFGGRAGKETLMNTLGESTYPHLDEQVLLTKGLLGIDKGGRFLTEAGMQLTLTLNLED